MELRYKFLAEDQYGQQVWIKDHPRKELCEHVGTTHAEKMYIDDNDGNSHHIGYVVGRRWFSIFKVAAWK